MHRGALPCWRPVALAVALLLCAARAEATRPRVALLPLAAKGVDPALVASIDDQFPRHFNAEGCCEVVSSVDISAMLRLEATRQKLGCDDAGESCLAELAGALGAEYVASGSVGRVGDRWTLALTLVSVQGARVVARFAENVKGPPDLLLDSVARGGRQLAAPLNPPRRIAGPLLLGTGAAALAAAVVTGLMWRAGTGPDLRQADLPRVDALALTTNILLGTGVVAGLAGGTVMLVGGGKER